MGYTLGIDFGTSTTKVALRTGDKIPQSLPIGKAGDYFMPSVVAYQRTKSGPEVIAVGEDAERVPETDDTYVVREIKRYLDSARSADQPPKECYPWWNQNDRCVELWGAKFSPQDVVLCILNEALERAVCRARDFGFGTEVDRFTIRGLPTRLGCSVTAELQTRKMLSEVARRLGFPEFKVSNLCEEPVLASLLYVHIQEIAPEETILIYDLGGGTFDTAVIKVHKESTIRRPVLTVFASDGEAFCGGADIDEALFKHLVTKLAEEHLGFKSKESMEILQLMSPSEKQILRNYARDAKERLSEREEITIELPPAFLGEPQIILSVTRAELEGVVSRIELVDETLECVLRAWRRARMLLRKEGEPVGNFYLRYDPSSGCVDRSVLQLGHEDLRESVRRVLVVGGASKMPFIRQRLTSLWGAEKLVPEDVIPSVEAASQGAAWQEDEIGAIVDRLPFSIILRWDGGEHELYRAFTPIVSYEILTTSPKITPFTSNSLSLPSSCKEAVIVLRNAEEEPMCTYPLSEVPRGKSHLEIDMFGHCMLKNDLGTTIEFSNPSQHPIQRKALERLKEEERDREEERRQRSHEMLHRPPFLEND